VVLVLLQRDRDGSLVVVHDKMDCSNPTLEQMAHHWFYSFGTSPSVESFCSLTCSFFNFRREAWVMLG
jgi:hypothetical protein